MAALAGTIVLGGPYAAALVIAAVMTLVAAPFRPAQFALIPQLAGTPTQIAGANVVWGMVEYAGFLGGSLAAACLVAPLGLAAAVASSVLPLALGTLALVGLPRDAPAGEDELVPISAWDELAAGVRTVGANAEMRLLTGFRGADAVVQGAIDVLLVSCAIDLLGTGRSGVGILNSAWGVRGLVGGWLALSLVGRGTLTSGVLIGSVSAGVPLALIAVCAVPAPAIALLVLLGVGFAVLEAALNTLLQRQASDTVAARVFGVNEALYMLGIALGGLVGGMLVSLLGIEDALVVTGLALPTLAVMIRRRIVRLQIGIEVPERPFTLLRDLEMCAPLPIATIERLAIRSTMMDIAAGAAVIGQSDQGDAFYVLDGGALDVFVDGRLVDKRLPGECFGEVALLHDQPRMATAQARSPSRVVVLERQPFLLAMGSHERSIRAAARLAEKRTTWATKQLAHQTAAP
jgi:CRP-like cAMP-binding protein